jgi:uncharacterized protein YerC
MSPARGGPEALRDQTRRLRREGGTYRSIAAAAGLSWTTVHDLATGRRHSTRTTSSALQKVTGRISPSPPG